MSALITIQTFDNMLDVNLAANRLETEGIECYVQDQYITTLRQDSAITFGGIRLQVREQDMVKAIEIMRQYGYMDNEQCENSNKDGAIGNVNQSSFLKKLPMPVKLLAILFSILAIVLVIAVFKGGY